MPDVSRRFIGYLTPEDRTIMQIQNFTHPLPRDKAQYSGTETSIALL